MLRFLMSDPPPNLSLVVTYRREDLAGLVPLGSVCRPPDRVASVLLQVCDQRVRSTTFTASSKRIPTCHDG